MKRNLTLIYSLFFALLGVGLSSCDKKISDEAPFSVGPKITASTVHFDHTSSKGFIEFEGQNVNVEVSKDADWLTTSLSGNRVILHVAENLTPTNRATEVVLSDGTGKTGIQVIQTGVKNVLDIPGAVEFKEEASTQTFPLTIYNSLDINVPEKAKNWLSVTLGTNNHLAVSVKANETTKSRTAEVTVTSGMNSATFTVSQLGIFKIEDADIITQATWNNILGDYIFTSTVIGDGTLEPQVIEAPVSLVELTKNQTFLLKGLATDLIVNRSGDSLTMVLGQQRLPLDPYLTFQVTDDTGGAVLLNRDPSVTFSARHQIAQEHLYYEFKTQYEVVDIATYFATGERILKKLTGFFIFHNNAPYEGPDPDNPKPYAIYNFKLRKVDPISKP